MWEAKWSELSSLIKEDFVVYDFGVTERADTVP